MPLLPGTPGERISDLCNGRHISQKELAKRIGVSAPQLSRIVSGETKTINSDLLIAVAKEFRVSTDYIVSFKTLLKRPYLSRVAQNRKTNEIKAYFFVFAPQNAICSFLALPCSGKAIRFPRPPFGMVS